MYLLFFYFLVTVDFSFLGDDILASDFLKTNYYQIFTMKKTSIITQLNTELRLAYLYAYSVCVDKLT